jgi:uncharacterized repeat protein (TIGR01451 family)
MVVALVVTSAGPATGTASSTPGPTQTAGTGSAISGSLDSSILIWAICIAMLIALIALLLYGWPSKSNNSRASNSVVRSWLAVSLTAGLLILTAASFGGNDDGLRKLLVGAVIAAVGGAGAFYFATKANESATAAILKAAGGADDKASASVLLLSKNADATALATPAAAGNVITYHYKVTNSGTDTLTGVVISDTLAPPAATDYVWPGAPGELKAGGVATAMSKYPIVQSDLATSSLTCVATAHGKGPTGPVIHSEQETTTTALS